MTSEENGYILLETLVALAVFSLLAVTTADVAQEAFRAGSEASVPNVEDLVERFRPPVSPGPDVRRIKKRRFPNGDQWILYRYRPGGRKASVRVPVLRIHASDTSNVSPRE